MITITWVDLISWAVTLASVILLITQWNARRSYYMATQGILRACAEKAKYYAALLTEIKTRTDHKDFTEDEFLRFVNSVYSDFSSLAEHVMGVMKAIEPGKDTPFDTLQFTTSRSKSKQQTDS